MAASTAPTTRAASWKSIADGLPADFGFPIVVHPHEPDTVYVFPINGGDRRYPPDGEGAGLALQGRGQHLGGARQGPAGRLLRRGDARRDVRRRPRHDRDLLRRPQRRGLGLARRGRDLDRDRQATCPTCWSSARRLWLTEPVERLRDAMADYEVVRSTTVNAPPATLHALIDDFREWRAWSPWEDLDPDLTPDPLRVAIRRRRHVRLGGEPEGRQGQHGDHRRRRPSRSASR